MDDIPRVKFSGRATIRVRFKSRAEYEKFRKYILKTEWSYDLDYPMWEEIVVSFYSTDDICALDRKIVWLLQMGFEVYCCKFQLEEQLAEAEFPREEDPVDMKQFVKDIWIAKKSPPIMQE